MRTHATYTRDAALRKLARINRWMIAGSVALTGVLSEVAAQAFPGRTKASAASATRRGAAHPSSRSTRARPAPLTPPATAPSTTTQAAPETVQESPRSTEPAPESDPAPQSAPQESAPAESTHESTPAPARESAPSPEPAPAQESPAPVVSGGS
jgi:DNA polymerase-3 subunit gamma/tau